MIIGWRAQAARKYPSISGMVASTVVFAWLSFGTAVVASTLPATDAFTAANGTALQTYNPNWTINVGAFDTQSNAVHPNGVGHSMAHWNANTFSNDQYSQMTITGVGSFIGVIVRATATLYTGYFLRVEDASNINIWKAVNSSFTQLATVAYATQIGDILRLEVTGSTLTGKVNGVTKLSVNDSSIVSGSAGIVGFGNTVGVLGDDWEGGNMALSILPRRFLTMIAGAMR